MRAYLVLAGDDGVLSVGVVARLCETVERVARLAVRRKEAVVLLHAQWLAFLARVRPVHRYGSPRHKCTLEFYAHCLRS